MKRKKELLILIEKNTGKLYQKIVIIKQETVLIIINNY